MKILPNIIPLIKIKNSLKFPDKYKADIEKYRREGNTEKEKEFILKASSVWGKNIIDIFSIDLTVNGRENLPEKGPVVYVSNHQGYGDIPVCCAALDKIQFGFIAKDNLFKIPVFGKWMLRIRSLSMDREDIRAAMRAIEEGVSYIKQGFSLLIFPEGTRSRGGRVKEFKKGSLKLATKPGVPVVPITIDGSYRIYEEKGKVVNNAKVAITIHPAIPTAGMSKTEQNQLAERVQHIIESALPEELHALEEAPKENNI